MRGLAAVVMAACALSVSAAEPDAGVPEIAAGAAASTAALAAETVAPPVDEPASLVLKEEGLSFTVPLPRGRNLRDRDPRFERLIQGLPELETDDVPFKKAWTESLAESFKDQLVNGPRECQPNRCEGAAVNSRRLQQMNTDLGPQDDWTWTPPAGY